jgi:glycosyltransferase involved in cell wall biosynthesis
MGFLGKLLYYIFWYGQAPFLWGAVRILPKRRQEVIWGPESIINNKYWSEAMRAAGYASKTLMRHVSPINKKEDFDLYFDDVTPRWIRPSRLRKLLGPSFALVYMMTHAKVIHIPFTGGPLGTSPLWRLEAYLFRASGIKTVVVPYGGDAYAFSQILDPSLRNALLINYGEMPRKEREIRKRVQFWAEKADAMVIGFLIDGMGRWDVPIPNSICINTHLWQARLAYSSSDGRNGPVKVLHTPNHRGAKGTEFLSEAVDRLQREGLQLELVLLEKIPNDQVREKMQTVDILADQFIATAYALSAIEGMASGLPVMSNLEHEAYTRVFRRYAFLNECPILSTTPENLTENLRVLVTNPKLREELGRAGRAYVEKYHSYEMAQYLFGSIYEKILKGRDVDLMNLFHPLTSEFNRRKPTIQHSLVENRLPGRKGGVC